MSSEVCYLVIEEQPLLHITHHYLLLRHGDRLEQCGTVCEQITVAVSVFHLQSMNFITSLTLV